MVDIREDEDSQKNVLMTLKEDMVKLGYLCHPTPKTYNQPLVIWSSMRSQMKYLLQNQHLLMRSPVMSQMRNIVTPL